MALRLRRDVQKASYYVWFLGAEEAKGLRGARIINSALPYLIDRARSQDPLKVTLQVSHKGIKILQGSSKHFIPHSAITSSVHTDDIVACVLLLYNPATKCPLHVHAYRCDSETTADALHQQLQILINRVENQKRFEELETRLGILPPIPTSDNKLPSHVYNEQKSKQQYPSKQQQQLRRQEASPKRLHSSLGSDTGNSTRESECSEERTGGSPMLPSPSNGKPATFAQQSNELFDSLAAELRAKLNGNGPPLLLPPRDYDTVHRSKGNLAAIELRRCRNSLIVGGATSAKPSHSMETATTTAKTVSKQVSSRGSSGIGSDLAPSPERQELNSSSDEEHWSNEADNSTIALKPSQISLERSMPIIQHQPQISRRNVSQPPEDSYLRDLPAKPYRDKMSVSNERLVRSKTPSSVASWSKEDEIKPIIVRPADYDAKFNRVLQTDRKQDHHNRRDADVSGKEHNKLRDTDKYDEINRLLNNKLSLERRSPEQRYKQKSAGTSNDFDDSDPSSSRDHIPGYDPLNYRKENLTDKQKCMEYSTKRQANSFAAKEVQRYGGRGLHRYVDPADLPFEQPQPPVATHSKYGVTHRDPHPSEEQLDIGHRTSERHREHKRETRGIDDPSREKERIREFDREHYSRDQPRNPYREPESIPYIQSMEKMMKSSIIRYKSFDGAEEPRSRDEPKTKSKQRDNSYKCNNDDNDEIRDHEYQRSHGHEYPTASSSKNHSIDLKDKFRIQERVDSRYNLGDERECGDYKPRHRRSSIDAVDSIRVYEDWSDEEQCMESSPLPSASRSRLRSKERHMFEERSREQHSRYESPMSRDPRIPQRLSNRPRGTDVDHSRKMLREYAREHGHREYSPTPEHRACYVDGRAIEKQDESYISQASPGFGEPISSGKSLSNHSKGYRHSYAEPVFARSGGRVGLAAVNPY